jgi:hypothetical protein
MDRFIGKTNFTISKILKETNTLAPSSMIGTRETSVKLYGDGDTLTSDNFFILKGLPLVTTDAVIPSDGLYQIIFTVWASNPFSQPKSINIRINSNIKTIGYADYNFSSSHSLFVELKSGDKISFGTTNRDTMILNRWLIRKVAPIGGI